MAVSGGGIDGQRLLVLMAGSGGGFDGRRKSLITTNHDVCVLNYVNDMNSRNDNHCANVINVANQKKHKPKVKNLKKIGSKERLTSPKPSKLRICLRLSTTGRIFDLKGNIIASSEFECQSVYSNGDNACTSNPQEPTSKQFPNSTSFLGRLSKFVYGTVCFGNDHMAVILGYDLEVAFRRKTCFVKNIEGVDMLKGNRTTNLYTINLYEIASTSPLFLMARATSTKSWLWLQPMYDDYIGGQPSVSPRTYPIAPANQVLKTLTASTTIVDTALTPTNSSPQAANIPNTSQDVDETQQ
nr:hypothetical protein [Tanacetum cinerariifolium]